MSSLLRSIAGTSLKRGAQMHGYAVSLDGNFYRPWGLPKYYLFKVIQVKKFKIHKTQKICQSGKPQVIKKMFAILILIFSFFRKVANKQISISLAFKASLRCVGAGFVSVCRICGSTDHSRRKICCCIS